MTGWCVAAICHRYSSFSRVRRWQRANCKGAVCVCHTAKRGIEQRWERESGGKSTSEPNQANWEKDLLAAITSHQLALPFLPLFAFFYLEFTVQHAHHSPFKRLGNRKIWCKHKNHTYIYICSYWSPSFKTHNKYKKKKNFPFYDYSYQIDMFVRIRSSSFFPSKEYLWHTNEHQIYIYACVYTKFNILEHIFDSNRKFFFRFSLLDSLFFHLLFAMIQCRDRISFFRWWSIDELLAINLFCMNFVAQFKWCNTEER